MRTALFVLVASLTAPALATLPPPSEDAKAQAAAAKARSDWSDKVSAYKVCLAGDRVAQRYRAETKSAAPTIATAPCVDPGPFVAEANAKPLEAAGAHSPPGTATSPPSSNATHAELAGGAKKPADAPK
jgi:hypothetical protein